MVLFFVACMKNPLLPDIIIFMPCEPSELCYIDRRRNKLGSKKLKVRYCKCIGKLHRDAREQTITITIQPNVTQQGIGAGWLLSEMKGNSSLVRERRESKNRF